MSLKRLPLLATALLLSACGSTDSGPATYYGNPAISCTLMEKLAYLYDVMHESYYWYQHLPTANYRNFSSTTALLDYMRYDPIDQWSFIEDRAESEAWYGDSAYIGVGYSTQFDSDGKLRLRFVYPDTPASRAGLERGFELVEVNGVDIDTIVDQDLWETIYGERAAGVSVQLRLRDRSGTLRAYTLTKQALYANPILYSTTYFHAGRKIGYFVFDAFTDPAIDELYWLLSDFADADVDEVVLDLRYNGGGLGSVARYLASNLQRRISTSMAFEVTTHNDKKRYLDERTPFLDNETGLDIPRIFVLTTGETCSASEMVINGLKPFLDVVQIGETTCGKPYGMYLRDFCDQTLAMVEFAVTNHYGDFAPDGHTPQCAANDDLSLPFGDTADPMLAQVHAWIDQGTCLATSASARGHNGAIPSDHLGPIVREHDGW